uniref:Putative secreted protein n=1 Tax=Anopheles darlingi TaxID=43151 RepID=A0A2M4DIA2_ANODA
MLLLMLCVIWNSNANTRGFAAQFHPSTSRPRISFILLPQFTRCKSHAVKQRERQRARKREEDHAMVKKQHFQLQRFANFWITSEFNCMSIDVIAPLAFKRAG